jgi:uncharacterized OB-fold protein
MVEIEGYACESCGKMTYSMHARCPSCGGEKSRSVPLNGRATLLTFSKVHMLSLAFTERFITLGIVEFDNGCRALGRLLVDEPRIGMKLKAETGTVRKHGFETIKGLCFREVSD